MNIDHYLAKIGIPDPWGMTAPTPHAMMPITAARKWEKQPVLFRVPAHWMETLRDTEINIPQDQYNQSYPSIMVQYPDGEVTLVSIVESFGPTRDNPSGENGRYLDLSHSYGMRKDGPGVYSRLGLTVRLDKGGYLTSLDRAAKTIEESVLDLERLDDKEKSGAKSYCRIAINAVLLLSGHPLYRFRSERERALIKQSKHGIRSKQVEAKNKLRLLPQVIDFVNAPNIGNAYGTDTDITKRVHWRKGHWRHQCCGAAWTDHKWIFIERVLIHADQWNGEGGDITFKGKGTVR